MKQVRCRFCHEYVDAERMRAHEAEHLKLRPDGQHSEYVTLPPEEREEGDLTGVPTVYLHDTCGVGTGMPEEIIRSYLKNPYYLCATKTFCAGCNTHVRLRECSWIETGENLQAYMDRLRAERPDLRPGLLGRLQIAIQKLLS